jgi:hypothetical protein
MPHTLFTCPPKNLFMHGLQKHNLSGVHVIYNVQFCEFNSTSSNAHLMVQGDLKKREERRGEGREEE